MNSLLECAFPPVIEPDLPGAFLTEHSQEMSTENSSKIPLIAGINFDEGLGISICKRIILFLNLRKSIVFHSNNFN